MTSNYLQKYEKEIETLIHAVRIYSQDIGMELAIGKCAMLVMKSGKRHLTDGMELPNQDKIKTFAENETYKYLGILEAESIKQVEMKDKIQKEYLRRIRKLLETKLNSWNHIKGINTWAVHASIQRLEDYIQKRDRGLITATRNDTDNTMDNRMTITRKQKWEGKQLHGRFKRLINISHDKTWRG